MSEFKAFLPAALCFLFFTTFFFFFGDLDAEGLGPARFAITGEWPLIRGYLALALWIGAVFFEIDLISIVEKAVEKVSY